MKLRGWGRPASRAGSVSRDKGLFLGSAVGQAVGTVGCEPGVVRGRPCKLPGCAVSTYPSLSLRPPASRVVEEGGIGEVGWDGRASRLLRDRGRRAGRAGAVGRPDQRLAAGARVVRGEPRGG